MLRVQGLADDAAREGGAETADAVPTGAVHWLAGGQIGLDLRRAHRLSVQLHRGLLDKGLYVGGRQSARRVTIHQRHTRGDRVGAGGC